MGFIKFKFEDDDQEEPFFGSEPVEKGIENISLEKESPKKEREEFIIDWEKRLGFSSDPFADTILKPVEKFITGYRDERESLNLFIIESRRFASISGEKGYGKSTLLCWLSKQLKKHSRKIIVVNADGDSLKEGKGFLSILIFPFMSIFGRISKKHMHMTSHEIIDYIMKHIGNKKLVLLVDDFDSISKQNLDILHNLILTIQIRVVFAGKPGRMQNFMRSVDSIKEFSDSLNVTLKGLDFSHMKDIIQKRVEFFGGISIEPFNESYLRDIYEKTSGSPSKMLNACHDEAMKLSVDSGMVRKLREEDEGIGNMVYSTEEFEHEGIRSDEFDKIEIIRHEEKKPIVINNKPDIQFTTEYEEKDEL